MGTVLALEGHRAPVFRWSPAQDSEDAEGRDELVFALQGQQKSWLANVSLSRSSVMFNIN